MPRNKSFRVSHEPFREQTCLQLLESHVDGPFSCLNPTLAHFRNTVLPSKKSITISGEEKAEPTKHEQLASDIQLRWRSRDNRKGRHALLLQSPAPGSEKYLIPEATRSLRELRKGLLRMVIQYPYWDISWLIATIFTLGSVVWVINAFFAYLPLAQPGTEFQNEVLYGGGITAFIGATIFEIGSILLMFEAVNEDRPGCFGWALERLIEGKEGQDEGTIRIRPDQDQCAHHHNNKKNLVGKSDVPLPSTSTSTNAASDISLNTFIESQTPSSPSPTRTWIWFPATQDLRTHYLHELGFLASLSQFLGATIFWISGFTALPGINNHLSQGALDGIFWVPQIIGGMGFIISGTLFMLETQSKWYKPAFGVLGWHIGFWNLVGAYGFTLCGALGPAYGNSGAQYEASLATFWGSCAFLIGSMIQWYESLDKHPVEVEHPKE